MLKLDINPTVVSSLTSLIKYTRPVWAKSITPIGVSKESFLEKTIPINHAVVKDKLDVVKLHNANNIDNNFIHECLEECKSILNASELTNAIMYRPMSEMPWHTDFENPGTRIYYTFTAGEAIFRYRESSGKIIEDYDNAGWTVRMFKAGDTDELLWHSVWTEKPRFSFGFKL